uniref:actin maturation protease-like n=1 Tax=Myxine glutinosa TaxID=7769 RepID=UPI00359003AD
MAGQALGTAGHLTVEDVFHTAVQRGYTAQGEMFSAFDLCCLAEQLLGCRPHLLSGGLDGANFSSLLAHILRGYPTLVPYDADRNYEPCLKRGQKAHWAVVTGALLGFQDPMLPGVRPAGEHAPGLFILPSSQVNVEEMLPLLLPRLRGTLLLAKQGKSRRFRLWESSRLAASNAQLQELDPCRRSDGTQYVLPVRGMAAGLAGKVLLFLPPAKQFNAIDLGPSAL